MTEQYETDEEEFMEKEISKEVTTLESRKTRNTAKQETRLIKEKRSNPAHSILTYGGMEREGKKKYKAKESREELDKHSMWIRSMLENKKLRNVNVLTRDWFQNNADKLPN